MTVLQTVVSWMDPREELPDDEITVLLALADGEVELGYHDAEVPNGWAYAHSGMAMRNHHVTHWAHVPAHPAEISKTP
jgi:hypothetical protein